MFCPNCGLKEERTVQFCRTCGIDLGAVRDTLEQPNSVAASAVAAREEIARAAAAKIKDGQWWQVGAIVPEVEKLFESPEDRRLRLIRADEEQRLRRIRAGVVTAASGLGAVLLFLLLSFAYKDALFLIGPSLTVLLIGLGIVINGLVFTIPKKARLTARLTGINQVDLTFHQARSLWQMKFSLLQNLHSRHRLLSRRLGTYKASCYPLSSSV